VTNAPFIAGDWGTTQLRLFLCDASTILDFRSGRGVRALDRSPEAEFTALTSDWVAQHRVRRAVLTGMVGSRNGWLEAPYVPCPASLQDLRSRLLKIHANGVEVEIVPGLSCLSPAVSPDVMRGEETQLFGAMLLEPSLAVGRHVIALPGTHSKWAEIDAGRIVRFQTAITGELFSILKAHSTLLAAGTQAAQSFDEVSFVEGLKAQGSILHRLFQVRSRQLIDGDTADQAAGLLSGLLIGADVDGAIELLQPDAVTLIGETQLSERYTQALNARGIDSRMLDANECVIAGLRAIATDRGEHHGL
jgi:2-dehydro-3-deoxygalactonokinase